MNVSLDSDPLFSITWTLNVFHTAGYVQREIVESCVSLMALSPFKTPQSPLNRSRSSSCSSPVRNRIVYQEIYSIGANTLVRSYSCDQVYDNDGNGRTFQTTKIQVASFMTPDKIHVKSNEGKSKKPLKLPLESPSDVCKTGDQKTEDLKKPSIMKTVLRRTMLFTFLTVTSACALYYYVSYRECSYTWDIQKTELELMENIFGQNQAVERIKSVLKMVNSTNDLHTVVFTGGVGVGKTYASSIIRLNFPWSSNKLLPYSEHFTEDVEQLLNQKLSTCGCNLLIVDDLSVKSTEEAIKLTALLNNKRQSTENLFIILIFQTRTADERNEILRNFKSTFLNANFISFQPLTRDDIKKCFLAEMKRQGVVISKDKLHQLVEDKMKQVDVVKGPSGCKGVDVEVASYFKKTTG